MVRTTIAFNETTLTKVRSLARREHRTLAETVGELVEAELSRRAEKKTSVRRTLALGRFHMGTPRVALEDKDAIRDLIEKEHT
jgi:hypothetical protein